MIPIIDQWISEFTESKKIYSTVVFNEYTIGRTVDIVNSTLSNFAYKKQIKSMLSNMLDVFSGAVEFSLSPIELQLALDDSKWGLFLRFTIKQSIQDKVKSAQDWNELKKITEFEGVSSFDEYQTYKINIQFNPDLNIIAISLVNSSGSQAVVTYERTDHEIPTIVESAISEPFPKFQIPELPPVESPFLRIKAKQIESEESIVKIVASDPEAAIETRISGEKSDSNDDVGVRIKASPEPVLKDDKITVKSSVKTEVDDSDSVVTISSSSEEKTDELKTIFSSQSEVAQPDKEFVQVKTIDNPELSKELQRVMKELEFITEKNKNLETLLANKNSGNSDVEYFKEKNRELETRVAKLESARVENEKTLKKKDLDIKNSIQKYEKEIAILKAESRSNAPPQGSASSATQTVEPDSLDLLLNDSDGMRKKIVELEALLANKSENNTEVDYFKNKNRELETKMVQIDSEKREWERKVRARELEAEKKDTRAKQIIDEYTAQKAELKGMSIGAVATSSGSETQLNNLIPESLTAVPNNEKIKSTVDDLKSQVADEKAKQALDSLYAELQAQKSQLTEAARNMSAEQKKLEFQMNSKIQLATQEATQAKLQADQKQVQLDRMKELMTNLQSRSEKQRTEMAKFTSEITQLRTTSDAYKRQLDEAQKEVEKLKKQKTETDQKSTGTNPMVKGLQEQVKNVEKQLLTKKQEVEQLKRQLQEKSAAETELKKQLAKLGANQPTAASGVKKAG